MKMMMMMKMRVRRRGVGYEGDKEGEEGDKVVLWLHPWSQSTVQEGQRNRCSVVSFMCVISLMCVLRSLL